MKSFSDTDFFISNRPKFYYCLITSPLGLTDLNWLAGISEGRKSCSFSNPLVYRMLYLYNNRIKIKVRDSESQSERFSLKNANIHRKDGRIKNSTKILER